MKIFTKLFLILSLALSITTFSAAFLPSKIAEPVEAQSCSGQITCCNDISIVCRNNLNQPCSPGSTSCTCTSQCNSWDVPQNCSLSGGRCQVLNGCGTSTGGCIYNPPAVPPGGTPPTPGNPTPPPSGGWGACGSCGSCPPGPSSQCVRAPDGACVWDPGACAGGGSGTCTVNSFNPSPINITVGQTISLSASAFNGVWETTANNIRWSIGYTGQAWGVQQDSIARLGALGTGFSVSNARDPQTVTINSNTITGLAVGSTSIRVEPVLRSINDGALYANCTRMVQVNVGAPACVPTAPGTPTLVSPVNNATISTNSVALQWSDSTPWGLGCPLNSNQYRVFVSPNCSGTFVQYNGYDSVSGGVYSRNLSNLSYGSAYCWYVQKHNGSLYANSPLWVFTVGNTPVDTSSGFTQADTCSYPASSGRWDNANTENPVNFSMTFNQSSGIPPAFYNTASLMLVPTTGAWAENNAFIDHNTLATKVYNSSAIGVAVNYLGGMYTVDSTGYGYSTGATGGANKLNARGTAQGMGANTDTRLIVSGANATANFKIRFEHTFPSGTYNVYGSMWVQNQDGSIVSSYANSTSNLRYKLLTTWTVDTSNPGSVIVGPTYNSNGSYNLTYQPTDNLGIYDTVNYITRSAATGALRDNTLAQQLAFDFAPNTHRGSLNNSNYLASPTRNYTDNGTGVGNTYTHRLDVIDRGCNFTSTSTTVTAPSPWLMTYQGNTSANGGFALAIPDNPTFTVPFSTDTGTPYLSTFGALSGDSRIPPARISKTTTFATTYTNDAVKPPTSSGFTSWFDYAADRVRKNNAGRTDYWMNEYTNPGPTPNVGGDYYTKSIADWIIIPKNSRFVYFMNGDQDLLDGSICDVKLILFISGNLRINPDITTTGDNGCLIFVKGNVTVLPGTKKPNISLGSAAAPNYDAINLYIVTDGTFTTNTDNAPGAGNQWEGLYINGGLNAQQVNFARDLNYAPNATNPSIVVKYDPRYQILFGNDLGVKTYSFREQL